MDTNRILSQAKTKLSAAKDHFQAELKKLRTGRAHPSMLDNVTVDAYGQPMPLKAVGNVTAPEAQLLQITPFDPNNLQAIAEAIRNDQSLGLSPTDDGHVVRIQLPPMTAENRQTMARLLRQKLEEAHISLRNIRHDAIQQAAQAERDKQLSKDEGLRFEKQIDELVNGQKNQLEAMTEAREKEILTL